MPNKRNDRFGGRIEAARARPESDPKASREGEDAREGAGENEEGTAMGTVNRMMDAACEAPGKMVRSYPAASMLTSFGIGFGLGLVVTTLLRPSRHESSSWSDSSVADALRGFSRSLMQVPQATAETMMSAFGRR